MIGGTAVLRINVAGTVENLQRKLEVAVADVATGRFYFLVTQSGLNVRRKSLVICDIILNAKRVVLGANKRSQFNHLMAVSLHNTTQS